MNNQATVTDPAGKQRRYTYDAAGRLTSVVEDPNGVNGNWLTSYSYDLLNNLVRVTQGSQTRTFTYDSLGRLTNTTQPESGAASYEYDNNGNMTARTDGRAVRTSYGYDALNRVTSKTYSSDPAGTPAVTYTYDDAAVAYGKGQLTKVANAYSATSYLNYDALGRVVQSSQATAGHTYSFSYVYDLLGSLTSETYPTGRVITTQYDAAERASSVAGALTSLQKNYLSSITYAPHGAMAAMQMGNNVWRVYSYNSRLQVQRIEDAVNNDPSRVLLDQQFDWGTNNNNGNLNLATTNHGGPDYPQVLTLQDHYWYDGVNRISNASGTDVSNNLLWAENFSYDRYGNVWTPSTAGLSVSGIMPQSNVFTNANRFQMGSYDAAGNQTFVGTYALDYDAENRQIKANDTGTLSTGTTLYQYDGNGQRVQKARDTGTTIYVYDAFGKLTSEYANFPTNALPCATCYRVSIT